MKLRYRNFTRQGADFAWKEVVREEHKRKRTSLYVIEVSQFLVGSILVLYNGYRLFEGPDTDVAYRLILLLLGLILFTASYLLAMDNYYYRTLSTIGQLALCAAVVFIFGASVGTVIIIALLATSIGTMHFNKHNKAYYLWAKSLSK